MGGAAMYKVDTDLIRDEYDAAASIGGSSSASPPSAISLHHAYAKPLVERLTSIHCNADDTLLSASGYTQSVNVHDLQTGQMLRRLKNIHSQHINLARFANMMPYLLLTCSFDQQICMVRPSGHRRSVRSCVGADAASHTHPPLDCSLSHPLSPSLPPLSSTFARTIASFVPVRTRAIRIRTTIWRRRPCRSTRARVSRRT